MFSQSGFIGHARDPVELVCILQNDTQNTDLHGVLCRSCGQAGRGRKKGFRGTPAKGGRACSASFARDALLSTPAIVVFLKGV